MPWDPGWLFDMADEILPNYKGIIKSQYTVRIPTKSKNQGFVAATHVGSTPILLTFQVSSSCFLQKKMLRKAYHGERIGVLPSTRLFARKNMDTTIIPEVINDFSTRIQKITLPETNTAPKNDGFQ